MNSLTRLKEFIQLLESSRQLQQDIFTSGYLCVDDVDGVGFENWDDEEEDLETETNGNFAGEKMEKMTLVFLNSDDVR